MDDVQHPSDTVLHEDAVEAVVDARIEAEVQGKHAAIADLAAASGAYVQAEATATRTAVNAILATLRAANIIAT